MNHGGSPALLVTDKWRASHNCSCYKGHRSLPVTGRTVQPHYLSVLTIGSRDARWDKNKRVRADGIFPPFHIRCVVQNRSLIDVEEGEKVYKEERQEDGRIPFDFLINPEYSKPQWVRPGFLHNIPQTLPTCHEACCRVLTAFAGCYCCLMTQWECNRYHTFQEKHGKDSRLQVSQTWASPVSHQLFRTLAHCYWVCSSVLFFLHKNHNFHEALVPSSMPVDSTSGEWPGSRHQKLYTLKQFHQ